jgi:predicted adenylyl cyclase CyaB
MSGPCRNLELKARDPDPVRSASTCFALQAKDEGFKEQRDTYFEVRRGRLKLREEVGMAAELIAYERPDDPRWRESKYRIVEVTDAAEIKAALSDTLGVKAIVAKRRHLFRLEGATIHLDEVEGIGSFIEFELAASPKSDLAPQHIKLESLRTAFEILDRDLVAGSYSDLVSARKA